MVRKDSSKECTTDEKAKRYEMLSPILDGVYKEVKELSKKKADNVLNKLKVTMVNRILGQIKEVLENEPTIQFMDLLDDETLPTNSDAAMILAQFRAAMDQYKERYYRHDSTIYGHRWFTKENP